MLSLQSTKIQPIDWQSTKIQPIDTAHNAKIELNPETKAIMSSYSAEIKQARQVDDVVFFEITLTLIDMQQNKREWTVLRRYSQFDALRSQLEKDLGIKVPKHPGLHLLDA